MARPAFRMPLRTQVSLAFGAIVLVVVALAAELAGARAREHVLDLHGKRLLDNAGRLAAQLDIGLYERQLDVASLAASIAQDLPRRATRDEIDQLRQRYPLFAWIGFTDPRGRVLAASEGVLEGRDVGERPWWQAGGRGVAVLDVHDAKLLHAFLGSDEDGQPPRLLDIAAPVQVDGQLRGVLGAHLHWAWAIERRRLVMDALDPAEGIDLFIFSADGRNLRLDRRLDPPRPASLDALLRAGPRPHRWTDGEHLSAAVRSTGYRDFKGLGWTIVVRQPLAPAEAAATRLQRAIWAGGLGLALVLIATAWVATGWLLRPLRAVAARAEAEVPDPARGDEAAQLSAALGSLIDRLKAREAELRGLVDGLEARVAERTAALEARNAELTGLARMIGHDIRAPVLSLASLLELARGAGDDRRAALMQAAVEECRRVGRLIDALHGLSVSGSRPLADAEVDMAALAAAAVARQREATGYAGEVAIGPLPPAQGDAELLGQVWANLVGNAMKFSQRSAQPRVQLSAQVVEGRCDYVVQDNGVGFEPARAAELFLPFARLAPGGPYQGSGLGLAIVRRIVERHGGEVAASATPGQGARFVFSLPRPRA